MNSSGRPDTSVTPKLTDRGGIARVSLAERDAMILMRAQGMSVKTIAGKLNRAADTVAKVLQKARKNAEAEAPDFKETMKTKAITAVNAGLDEESDAYKRGNLGVQVLKGIGVFIGDNQSVTIHNLIAAVPEKWRERYITNDGVEERG